MRLFALGVSVVLGMGCAEDVCVEDHVTITQGIYGQVTIGNDASSDAPKPISGYEVALLDGARTTTVLTVVTDANGLFQAELAPGTYVLGESSPPRLEVVVESGKLVRTDFDFAGYWNVVPRDTCAD